MKITGLNQCQQGSPLAFQMRIGCNRDAKKIIFKEVKDFYSGCVPAAKENFFGILGKKALEPNKIFKEFKCAFEKQTKTMKGKVELIPYKSAQFPDEFLEVTYKYPNGKILRTNHSELVSEIILPNNMFDKGKPFNNAARGILACISDAMAKEGRGYGENNPAHVMLKSLA